MGKIIHERRKELGLSASDAQLDQLYASWDKDKTGVITIEEFERLLKRRVEYERKLDPIKSDPTPMGVKLPQVEQSIALRTAEVDKGAANLLQGLDIDESLGLDQVDEQIRDYLTRRGARVIELFRQWDDDQTGRIEKKEFRRGMKASLSPPRV